jgi:hypothetical protein
LEDNTALLDSPFKEKEESWERDDERRV